MLELAALQGALGSIKSITDITSAMIGLKSAADVNSKAIELQSVILKLQSDVSQALLKQTELMEENRLLRTDLSSLQSKDKDLQRYRLYAPWRGSNINVYALPEADAQGEPAHYLCPNCYQSSKKSILIGNLKAGGWLYLECGACTREIATGKRAHEWPHYAQPPD